MSELKALVPRGLVLNALAALLCAVVLDSCSRPNAPLARQLSELQSRAGSGASSAARIASLEREIAKSRQIVDRTFSASQRLSGLYETLGLQYLNNKMYGMALRSFQEAIQLHPTDPALFYAAGLCQGQMAKVEVDPHLQTTLFTRTAAYYTTALKLNPNYQDALFALAVVDIFELDSPGQAQPLLEHLLALDAKNVDGMFLLARVYAGEGRAEDAARLYDRIVKSASTQEQRSRAQEDKRTVLERAYGK